jgi:Ca-activated chloride channel family protein
MYNRGMPRGFWRVVRFGAVLQLCITAVAWRSVTADDSVEIVPRARPTSSAGAADTHTVSLRVDSSLVLIPVHVTTPLGATVANLARENFQLFEENALQTITLFATDDAPMSIGLLFDASGSMKNKKQKVSEAAASFFKTANKEDEFFLVEFNDRAKLVVPFTPEVDELYSKIASSRPFGRTALLDGVHLALQHMKRARNLRKALVILSDGGDNWSRHKVREVKTALLESDVQVYAMGIFDEDSAGHSTREEREGPSLLNDLAEQTGGLLYRVNDIDDLPAISARISRDLRTQYLLGYSPTHPVRDGKYRRVQVKLTVPKDMPALRAYFRLGYYGAPQ